MRKSEIAMLQERERQGKAEKGPDHDRARERMIERTSKRENERARKGEGKQRKSQGGRKTIVLLLEIWQRKNKSNRVRITDAFSRTARVHVFESSFKWHTILFLMLFCSKLAHFSEIQLVWDRRTDGPTDGHTLL